MAKRRVGVSRWLLIGLVATAALLLATAAEAKKAKLSVEGATATEGSPLSFSVSLSAKAKKKVTATYSTAPGSAGSGDFREVSGKLKIKKGKRGAVLTVATVEDGVVEPTESMSIELSRPKNAKIASGKATGQIEDVDTANLPALSLASGGSVSEGNPPNGAAAALQATLSKPSAQTVTAGWTLSSGAQASDFTTSAGTVTFPPGQTSTSIGIDVVPDYVEEPNEAAVFTLSNPANATIGTANGGVNVLDDDAGTGDLVITELMPNPNDFSDTDGEWVEVYNADGAAVNMAGLHIFTAATARCTFTGTLAANAITLAAGIATPASNGLPNLVTCADPIILTNTGQTVAVGPPSPGPVIDTTTYAASTPGASLSLDPGSWTAAGNDSALNFCPGTFPYFSTDLGTPGALNPACP